VSAWGRTHFRVKRGDRGKSGARNSSPKALQSMSFAKTVDGLALTGHQTVSTFIAICLLRIECIGHSVSLPRRLYFKNSWQPF
jgi:hypothetical protein